MISTLQPLPNGHFDVQDKDGQSILDPLGGPFRTREAAEAAQRMLSAFDAVDDQIKTINSSLEKQNGARREFYYTGQQISSKLMRLNDGTRERRDEQALI